MFLRQLFRVCSVLFAISVIFASAAGAAPMNTASYRINPGDVLQIFVWNEQELTRDALVQPDGMFSFPMVGSVRAGGATTDQIADKIKQGLGDFLRDTPVVTVSLLGIQGNKIFVLGKVARPGEFVLNSETDVMQALALAGGLNPFAAEDDIRILRRDDSGDEVSIPFHYDKVKEGKELDTNIMLKSGDVLVVP